MTAKQSPRLAWAAWLLTDFGKGLMMTLLRRLKESGQVPNTLSWFRLAIALVPAVMIYQHADDPSFRWLSLGVFALIVATDALDGHLARSWKQESKLGEWLDPLADKVLVVGLVVALCLTGILALPWGWWFLSYNVVRELGVPAIALIRKIKPSKATRDGKIKMILQTAGIILAVIPASAGWWQVVIWAPLVASIWFSITSGIAYLRVK